MNATGKNEETREKMHRQYRCIFENLITQAEDATSLQFSNVELHVQT